MPGFTEDLPFV